MQRLMTMTQMILGALLVMVSSALMSLAMPSDVQPVNRIVAIVNNTPITETQVTQMLKTAPSGQAPSRQQAIEALINQSLQLQMAKNAGITVGTSDVNQALSSIAARNNMTVAQMKTHLVQTGVDWQAYLKEIRTQLIMTKIQQAALAGKVNISQAKVKAFIADHADQLGVQTKYQYSDLLIPTDATMTADKAKALAVQVKRQATAGAQLSSLLTAFPKSAQAVMLLSSKWQTPDAIPDSFIAILNQLKAGQISAPLVTGNGVHLLQLVQKQVASPQLEQQRATDILGQQAYMKAVEDWVASIRKQAFIKIMSS